MTAKFVHSISAKILFLFTMFVYDCYCDINEVKLQQHLFSNNPPYHHMARPVKLPTTKIWANFSISISQIVSIGKLVDLLLNWLDVRFTRVSYCSLTTVNYRSMTNSFDNDGS